MQIKTILSFYPNRKVQKVIQLFLIMMVFSIHSFAAITIQGKHVKINESGISLSQIIKQIEKQVSAEFVYKSEDLKEYQNLKVQEEGSVTEVLNAVLEDTNLKLQVKGDVYLISKKAPEQPKKKAEQKKTIKGKVTDDKGVPLPGVSVVIKGSNIGVATNIDGEYTIEFEQNEAVFVFSFVGMISQEIPFTGQIVQNITLFEDSEQIAEVVVTGYQSISKERATGSFSVLTSENISNNPNEIIGDNLESLAAGVQTTVSEYGETQIMIRGVSSLTGDRDPLVVVDGFPIEGGFGTINRNDIDKITILKDAAAASIWGARAANGVIVVSTKKGKKAKGIQINFEAYTKISEDVDLDYANPIADSEAQLAYELMMWQQGYRMPSYGITSVNNSMTPGNELFQKQLDDHKANGGSELPTFTLDTPELQKLMGQSYQGQVKNLMLRKPVSQNYNISLRGQSEKNQFALSVMYNKNKQAMKEDQDDNLLINFRNNMKVAKWLDFDFSVMTQLKNQKSGGVDLSDIKEMAAYELLLDEDGNYNNISTYSGYDKRIIDQLHEISDGWSYNNMVNNPLQNMRSQDFKTKTFNTRINAGLNFTIAEGIKYSVGMQFSRGNVDIKNRYKEESYYVRKLVNDFNVTDYDAFLSGTPQTITEHQVPKGEIVYLENTQTRAYVIRNQFSIDKNFGNHGINFIAGTELNWNEAESKDDWLYGYNHEKYTNELPAAYNNLTRAYYAHTNTSDLQRGGILSFATNKFFSLFSNMAYTFKDKYSLSGSVRTDASNITVKESKYRYAPFWSVGASWQLSKENFMSEYDWVNRATLRATYGVNGNIPWGTAQVPLINYVQASSWWGSTGAGVEHAKLSDLGNPTLGWEKVKQLNIALDFAVLGNKLFGSVEYYSKQSEDLVAEVALPSISGTDSQAFNVAKMRNNGIELNLNANIKIANHFIWTPIFNFAYNKSKVKEVKVPDLPLNYLKITRYVEGYAYQPVWSYQLTGNVNEFGIPLILGKNDVEYPANVNIAATGIYGPDVTWYRGSKIAPYVSSFTNQLKFKGFSLLATVTGKFGHYMYNNSFSYNTRTDAMNFHEDLEYLIDGRADEIGMFPLPEESISSLATYSQTSTYLESRVEKADYIRLKEIMLSYNLPGSIVSKLGLAKIKFYTHISNVGLLWTANNRGIDPEYRKGLNFFKPERTYTLGVNVNF